MGMSDEPKASGRRELQVRWEMSDVPTIYANQLLLTHGGPEFYFIFGEIIPVDDADPMQVPDVLKVRPRVRIAVSREVMHSFVDAIDNNFAKFSEKLKTVSEREQHANSDD